MITIKMKNINIVFCEKNGIIPTNNWLISEHLIKLG
jgi:hypothetical protein